MGHNVSATISHVPKEQNIHYNVHVKSGKTYKKTFSTFSTFIFENLIIILVGIRGCGSVNPHLGGYYITVQTTVLLNTTE